MFRLILLILFVAAMLVAGVVVLSVVASFALLGRSKSEEDMPKTFQRVAYVALVILLFGLSIGWLGGL
ncbi:hypothetical protein [Yoonia sp. SS1-5]|uniref:Uncharacterized protein n=1 Tax=Yoonia rhodophyticola TaxID=3137370 RepID=A0AAN0NK71_9RHOB